LAQTSSLTSEAARRYATALFDMAKESGSLAEIQTSFEGFAKTLASNEDLALRKPNFQIY